MKAFVVVMLIILGLLVVRACGEHKSIGQLYLESTGLTEVVVSAPGPDGSMGWAGRGNEGVVMRGSLICGDATSKQNRAPCWTPMVEVVAQ